MKAAVIELTDGRKKLNVCDLPDPDVGSNDVLVRVRRVGVCGSDTHGFIDDKGTSRAPGLAMGHEIGGVVESVGSAVTRLVPGQRVHVDPQVVCGQCGPCQADWISVCDNKRVLGSSLRGFQQGGMAELVVADEKAIWPLPDEVTDEQAPLLEPLANALHVLRRVNPQPGSTVLVIGAGPLGLCMVEGLFAHGVHTVIVSETSPVKRAIAAGLGEVMLIDPATEDLAERVAQLVGPGGVDLTIEAVGIEATYRQAIAATRKRGNIAFFGAVAAEITLPLLPILHKELHLIGCTGANRAEIAEAIELVASGRVRFTGWPIQTTGFDGAEAAIRGIADTHSSIVKVLVDPSM